MSDENPTLKHGDEYVVLFSGGPNDAQSDTRIATESGWDDEIYVNGLEEAEAAEFAYKASKAVRIGDTVQVTYVWDPKGADTLDAPEERYDS